MLVVAPNAVSGNTPGPQGSQAILEISGQDLVPFFKDIRVDIRGIIPTVPELAIAELFRLPA